jgi:hypothetical protein
MGLLSKAAGKNDGPAGTVNGGYGKETERTGEQGGGFPVPPEYQALRGLPGELKNEIIKYCNTYTLVHGIVLLYPGSYDEEKEGEPFNLRVNRMVSVLGTAVPLPSRDSLVLFSNTIDRELLAHRLSKNLETEAPVVFQSDNVASVVDYIRPYL